MNSPMKVFWSWQADTPGETGRFFVRDAIAAAIKKLKQAEDIEEPTEREVVDSLHLDQDRQGLPGSPDLARAILEKINRAGVVIADVTIVSKAKGTTTTERKRPKGRSFINPNVGIELGYALKAVSDERVLLVMNTHYGPSDELPFDLRHKGVSLLYDLPPDADKEAIEGARAQLVARLVPALRHYVTAIADEAPVTFNRWPAKRSPAFFFNADEVLAKVGVRNVDEAGFMMTAERAVSLRLIPRKRPTGPISPRQLSQLVDPSLGAFWIRGFGGLTTLNEYGAIVYEPTTHNSEFNEMRALTQVFQTGEIWGVNAHLLRDRGDFPDALLLPALVFEKTCFDTLHRYINFARDKLGLEPPFEFEGALQGVKGANLWFQYQNVGPIHQESITYRTVLKTTDDNAINAALLGFFQEVYDQTPYARPSDLFGFPPGPPSEYAAVLSPS